MVGWVSLNQVINRLYSSATDLLINPIYKTVRFAPVFEYIRPMTPLEDLVKNASDIRGAIINDTILLERYIDEYIARYMTTTQEKKLDLMEMILCTNRMTYSGKTEVFVEILVKTGSPLVASGKKSFLDGLKKIGSIRNFLAHHLLDTSDEGIKLWTDQTTIQFIRFDKESKPFAYNQDKINEAHRLLEKYVGIVGGLLVDTPLPSQTME